MKRTHLIDKLKIYANKLRNTQIWIYGSEARGDAMINSDVDLLILLNKDEVTLNDRMAINDVFLDFEMEEGIAVNSFIDTKSHWGQHNTLFRENVNRDRIAL